MADEVPEDVQRWTAKRRAAESRRNRQGAAAGHGYGYTSTVPYMGEPEPSSGRRSDREEGQPAKLRCTARPGPSSTSSISHARRSPNDARTTYRPVAAQGSENVPSAAVVVSHGGCAPTICTAAPATGRAPSPITVPVITAADAGCASASSRATRATNGETAR